jgi:hypothetical protein
MKHPPRNHPRSTGLADTLILSHTADHEFDEQRTYPMQSRTLGKIAVLCAGAAIPLMAASQAHAAVAAPPDPSSGIVQTDTNSMAMAQGRGHELAVGLGVLLSGDCGTLAIGAGAGAIISGHHG